MSNQIGIILSFFFLTIFIMFSSELIAYQQISAKSLANTNMIAIYIQKNGLNEKENITDLDYYNYFNKVEFNKDINSIEGLTIYNIKTSKSYSSFTKLFNYNSKEIICQMTICRKE
ncbi:MAG: hypothetical protein SOU19_08415 [Candidatus Caccosoma sp.]|nr:hypothetical protein [Candidatus Caccosoma sp.]